MRVEELKKMLKNSTAVLVLDEGEPSFVMLNYDAYKKMVMEDNEREIRVNQNRPGVPKNPDLSDGEPAAELEILERINRDIMALKDEIAKEEKATGIARVD
jgi:hypothetical protein